MTLAWVIQPATNLAITAVNVRAKDMVMLLSAIKHVVRTIFYIQSVANVHLPGKSDCIILTPTNMFRALKASTDHEDIMEKASSMM